MPNPTIPSPASPADAINEPVRSEPTPRVSPVPCNEADLEAQANQLLAGYSTRDGIYTETKLNRKIRLEEKRLPELVEQGVTSEMLDYLVERQLDDLIDAADLEAIEEIIYRLHVAGFDTRSIASSLGIRRGTVEQRLRTVKRRIRAAYNDGIYAGWYEVYLSEVNRLAYVGR